MEPQHRLRTGDEPSHARSPLRLRLALAIIGLAYGLAGIAIFGFWLRTLPFLVLGACVAAFACVNIVVVSMRIRQGERFQPGRDVPPYRPTRAETRQRQRPARRSRQLPSQHRRAVRFVAAMAVCVVLIVLAWFWVRYSSVLAAGIMSVVAVLLVLLSVMTTNASSPILRGGDDDNDDSASDSASSAADSGDSGDAASSERTTPAERTRPAERSNAENARQHERANR